MNLRCALNRIYLLLLLCALSSCGAIAQKFSKVSALHNGIAKFENPDPLPEAELLKLEWLDTPNCDLPCWHTIRLGVTSRDDALSILESLGGPLVDPFGTIEIPYPYRARDGYPTKTMVSLDSAGVITSIKMDFPVARLDEAIAVLGEPTHVIGTQEFPPDPAANAPTTYWHIRIVWLEKGVALSRSGPGAPPDISASFKVDYLQFFVPLIEDYERVAGAGKSKLFVPWRGYGEFGIYDSTSRMGQP